MSGNSSVLYAAVCFIAAFGYGSVLLWWLDDRHFLLLPVFSSFSAAGWGFLLWQFIIRRRNRRTYPRAILAGVLTVYASHAATLYLLYAQANVLHVTVGYSSSLGEPPADLLSALYYSAVLGFYSMLFIVGWVSVPMGVVLSALYLGVLRRFGPRR